MNGYLVSIIIPAYNHEKYIAQCLDSVIAQTYPNIELIIINDGSSDSTDRIIDSYGEHLRERFSRYIYIDQENGGVCNALNKGLDVSSGDYVAICASDDIMFPKRIEKQAAYFVAKPDHAMVFTDGYHVYNDGVIEAKGGFEEQNKFSKNFDIHRDGYLFEWLIDHLFFMPSSSVCIARWCFEDVGRYDQDLPFEDTDMFLRVAYKHPFGFVDNVLMIHRKHGLNTGGAASIFLGLEMMLNKYVEEGAFGVKTALVANRLSRTIGMMPPAVADKFFGKKVIGWGCGGYYERTKKYNDLPLEYIVDSDENKHGEMIDGLEICSSDRLLGEDRSKVFVLINSNFRHQISSWLSANGFVDGENFY